jgi:hypothetical protein
MTFQWQTLPISFHNAILRANVIQLNELGLTQRANNPKLLLGTCPSSDYFNTGSFDG